MAGTSTRAGVDGAEQANGLLCSRWSYTNGRHGGQATFVGGGRRFKEVETEAVVASCSAPAGRSSSAAVVGGREDELGLRGSSNGIESKGRFDERFQPHVASCFASRLWI